MSFCGSSANLAVPANDQNPENHVYLIAQKVA
jgi:hypothetical protein